MRIVEFNSAAERSFRITRAKALEMFLYELLETADFEEVIKSRTSVFGKKVTLQDPGITVIQNIVYIEKPKGVLGILQDITLEEEKNQLAYKVKMDTIEMAQKVIDKQMLVAQQIAGLLGETTAETKVTLTKLRDTILYDGMESPNKNNRST
jgi:hypothetical protein